MERYDLCVLGGGPAGYAAAMRAIDFGKKVILIEKSKVGGAGVYNGALSSKTWWELSQKVRAVNESIVSVGRSKFGISWKEVNKTEQEALFDRKFQYSCHIKLLQEESMNNIFTYQRGYGKILTPNEVEIDKSKGPFKIWADNIIIATGSRPRSMPHVEVDEKIIMTSDGIHQLEDYPKSLVIVGAGVIGCEYATIFANFGKTRVHVIDRADRILPFEDDDISTLVDNNLTSQGVVMHHSSSLERLEIKDGEVEYELSYEDGRREIIRVEKALLAIGRTPNVENIGLENVGIQMGQNGRHIGDDDTRTNVPNIYAVGDASGRIKLVNMGEIEARHAVEKIFGNNTNRLSYDNVSTIMFLQPEVAAVGMNEKTAREKNIPIKVVKIDYSCIARAIAMRKTEGFFKIIVTNDEEMKILGMRAIGEHASSAVQAVALLIKQDRGIEELAELVHPHPSIIEGIQECVRMLLNKSIFKSSVFKDKLKCYSCVDGVCVPLQRL
ncbi:NAD(P)/FAD-dependent oxidoreductase [Flavobacteriales bacterium]|nr:NAD(P)/FAD-dependent oxidoreductase [Flavobacteriales bacterium]MDC3338321.1 NAD(P)/FAD-dependent oxidoreductase [Flavobacteriales bacterium]